MESITITADGTRFDELVHKEGRPAECGDLELALKIGATVGGEPGVAIGFTTTIGAVQLVTTLALLEAAVAGLRGFVEGERARRASDG